MVAAPREIPAPEPPSALTCAQVRPRMSAYTDGVLPPETARLVEAHLAQCAQCRRELAVLKSEEAMVVEALTDLRPSSSYRGRVSQLCVGMREKAARVAESLPERGWAVLRWGLAFVAVAAFTALWLTRGQPVRPDYDPPLETFLSAASPLFWVNTVLFAVAVFFLVEGRLVAQFGSYLNNRLSGEPVRAPSRLEVVGLETFGLLGVLATSLFHVLFLAR